MDGDQSILKQDQKGRVRTPAERREQLLEEFGRSGLSGPKFAALVGVKYSTFAGWAFERRRRQSVPAKTKGALAKRASATPFQWLEAMPPANGAVEHEGAIKPLSIHLGVSMRLEISDRSQVPMAAALLKALEVLRPC